MIRKVEESQWKDILSYFNKELTSVSYRTWFEPLEPLYIDEDKSIFYVATTYDFTVSVIYQNDRYIKIFKEALKKTYNKDYNFEVSYKTEEEIKKIRATTTTESGVAEESEFNTTLSIDPDSPYKEEYYINPRYKFDNFVVGPNNNYAHAVALAVAENPAQTYNPLFIYGGSGLGKTHLMNAIGNYILTNDSSKKVLYVSSEMFTNELIRAVQKGSSNVKLNAFKSKYRSVDVLLIDDIQFLEGKESTQNEFFHTFNTLYDFKKQIVITSDRHPSKLKDLDDRLRSRFQWNIIADIQPPDYETRVAILRNKAEQEQIKLDDDVLQVINMIAEKVKFNIRELESALLRTISFSQVFNAKITPKFAREKLNDIFSASDKTITCDMIKKTVCSKYGIKINDMDSSKRKREFTYPRQVAMYLCRELTDLSLPKIGSSFGGRDHTTVLHAYEKISNELKTNETLAEEIRAIKEALEF